MQSLTGLLNLIPHVIVILALLRLLLGESSTEAILMLAGSIITFSTALFFSVLMPLFVEQNGYESIQSYIQIIGVVGILGALLFAVGFMLFIQRVSDARKK